MGAEVSGLRDRRMASGRAVRIKRLPWAGMAALVIVVLLATTTVDEAHRQARAIGADLEETELGLEVLEVAPRGPAQAAGLRAGDVITWAAGREISNFAEYDRAATTFGRGLRADFKILRDGRTEQLRISPGRPFPWLRVIVEWLACLAYLALGTVALVQLPKDVRSRLLMVLCYAVALELALPVDHLALPGLEHFSFPFLSILVGFQLATELHLAASIPDRLRFGDRRRWLVPAFYGLGLSLGLFHAVTAVAESVGWTGLPWAAETADLVFWDVGSILWAIAVVALLATAALRTESAHGRQQTLLVLMAGLPWSVHMILVVVSSFLGFDYPEWAFVVEPLVILAYPVGVLVAIFRCQLFDLELVVKRSLVYACLTGALVLVFYAAIGAGGAFLSGFLQGDGTSVFLIGFATLIMGLLFSPLRRATQRLIDRQFFPERTALRKELIRVASDLPARGSLPSMGHELVEKMSNLFGLESAAVLLGAESGILTPLAAVGLPGRAEERLLISSYDPGIQALGRSGRPLPISHLALKSPALERRMESVQAAILVPLRRREQLIGVLVLGRKIGGRPFPAEEVELLNLLSRHVATAFEYSQLYESATRDSLTGLLRRGALLDTLNRELDRSRRFGRPLAIALADIDRFKDVNDRYGHLKGDLILKRVGAAMTEGLRVTDQIGRYGGEEFVVVLPETDLEGAHVVAEKLRKLVERVFAEADNGEQIRVTISLGVAALDQFPAGVRPEVNDLLQEADAALYQAKTGGRNRVEARAATG